MCHLSCSPITSQSQSQIPRTMRMSFYFYTLYLNLPVISKPTVSGYFGHLEAVDSGWEHSIIMKLLPNI